MIILEVSETSRKMVLLKIINNSPFLLVFLEKQCVLLIYSSYFIEKLAEVEKSWII